MPSSAISHWHRFLHAFITRRMLLICAGRITGHDRPPAITSLLHSSSRRYLQRLRIRILIDFLWYILGCHSSFSDYIINSLHWYLHYWLSLLITSAFINLLMLSLRPPLMTLHMSSIRFHFCEAFRWFFIYFAFIDYCYWLFIFIWLITLH